MAVIDCSVPLASVSVSDGEASPETLVVSVDRKLWAAFEIWVIASCVEDRRAFASPFESTMPLIRSRSRSKETDVAGARSQRQADVGDASGGGFLLRVGQLALRAQQRIAHRL